MHGSFVSDFTLPNSDVSLKVCDRVAGVDTSSTSLSYFCWELTRRKDVLRNLQTELDEHMPDRRVIPDFTTLCKLPYLNAFLKEGVYQYVIT